MVMNDNEHTSISSSDDKEKLLPEWKASADDQTLFLGLAVFVIFAGFLSWNFLFSSDDDDSEAAKTTQEESADIVTTVETAATQAAPAGPVEVKTTAAAKQFGEIDAAIAAQAGDVTGVRNGSAVTLTGWVADQAESDQAEKAASNVEGVETVDNQLQLLEPAVVAALEESQVVAPLADGTGTEVIVRGSLGQEEDRAPTLAAAGNVEGVTKVIDELTVSVTAELNELPKVNYQTGSAVIVNASFTDLDEAAEILNAADENVKIEIQGYTDTQGPDEANLTLSQNRAQSVYDYLVDTKGVDEQKLSVKGYGETEQFGTDLESNRLVRFQELG